MPAKKNTTANTEVPFETRLERLQEIIEELEKGNIPLEDGLRLYKEGIVNAKACQEQIQKAKHEIKILEDSELKDFKVSL